MTPDELKALARDFKGPISIDHGHPVVDGPLEFGRLESVEVSPDGTTLYGNTVHPSWVNTALADAKWLVSASFDRSTKAIRRLSLVTRPQISDAELQAAFACACGGHDTPTTTPTPKEVRRMSTQREKDIAALQAMTDDDYDALVPDEDEEEEDMEEEDLEQIADDEVPADISNFAEDPEKAALLARLEALEDERRVERAANFAAAEVAASRIMPHERDIAEDVMYRALVDDATIGTTANFSVGGKSVKGTREAMQRAAYGQRRPHNLTSPATFGRGGTRTLDGDDGPETDQQYARRVLQKYNGRNKINGPAS
jgi:hypothetical protein